jgi:hypothetical protein
VKSLPAPAQQTISQQAAGGEIVRVKREDDINGKWNDEVIVKTNGQEWAFEVDERKIPEKAHRDQKVTAIRAAAGSYAGVRSRAGGSGCRTWRETTAAWVLATHWQEIRAASPATVKP